MSVPCAGLWREEEITDLCGFMATWFLAASPMRRSVSLQAGRSQHYCLVREYASFMDSRKGDVGGRGAVALVLEGDGSNRLSSGIRGNRSRLCRLTLAMISTRSFCQTPTHEYVVPRSILLYAGGVSIPAGDLTGRRRGRRTRQPWWSL